MPDAGEYGALYVAFGVPYLAMALFSASTLRKTNPGMPIRIVSNVAVNPADIPFWDATRDSLVVLPLESRDNRHVKTSAVDHSPFAKTVYLDCDTFVNGDLSDGALLLDYFNIGFRGETDPPPCDAPVIRSYPVKRLNHWNSGVFLFDKSPEARDFFRRWREGYARFGVEFDQVSLVEAIFTSSARMYPLEGRWNHMSFYSLRDPRLNRNAKVVHYTSRIGYAVERELYAQCRHLPGVPGARAQVRAFIEIKRRHRKKKLGALRFLKLRLLWLIHP